MGRLPWTCCDSPSYPSRSDAAIRDSEPPFHNSQAQRRDWGTEICDPRPHRGRSRRLIRDPLSLPGRNSTSFRDSDSFQTFSGRLLRDSGTFHCDSGRLFRDPVPGSTRRVTVCPGSGSPRGLGAGSAASLRPQSLPNSSETPRIVSCLAIGRQECGHVGTRCWSVAQPKAQLDYN